MEIQRIALIYDDSLRPDTTGGYCRRALADLARGDRWTTTYNSIGNPTVVIDPLGNITSLAYDLNGNLVERQDALGNRWSSVFDSSNRQVAQLDPLDNRTSLVYDDAGRPISSRGAW